MLLGLLETEDISHFQHRLSQKFYFFSYKVIRLLFGCVHVCRMPDLGYFASLGKELGLEDEELLKFATDSWLEQKDIAREERKLAREEKQEADEREDKRLAREDKLESEELEERNRTARLEVEEKERERRHELELLTAKISRNWS